MLLERWRNFWTGIGNRCSAAHYDLIERRYDLDEAGEPLEPTPLDRFVGDVIVQVDLFAERMLVLAHVVEQRTPEDINAGHFSLEEVGRAVYTAKAIVAVVLDRQGACLDDKDHDAVCVAIYNERMLGGHDRATSWDEIVVPAGFGGWVYELRHDSSG